MDMMNMFNYFEMQNQMKRMKERKLSTNTEIFYNLIKTLHNDELETKLKKRWKEVKSLYIKTLSKKDNLFFMKIRSYQLVLLVLVECIKRLQHQYNDKVEYHKIKLIADYIDKVTEVLIYLAKQVYVEETINVQKMSTSFSILSRLIMKNIEEHNYDSKNMTGEQFLEVIRDVLVDWYINILKSWDDFINSYYNVLQHHEKYEQITCPKCNGEGFIEQSKEESDDEDDYELVECPLCSGTAIAYKDFKTGEVVSYEQVEKEKEEFENELDRIEEEKIKYDINNDPMVKQIEEDIKQIEDEINKACENEQLNENIEN